MNKKVNLIFCTSALLTLTACKNFTIVPAPQSPQGNLTSYSLNGDYELLRTENGSAENEESREGVEALTDLLNSSENTIKLTISGSNAILTFSITDDTRGVCSGSTPVHLIFPSTHEMRLTYTLADAQVLAGNCTVEHVRNVFNAFEFEKIYHYTIGKSSITLNWEDRILSTYQRTGS